MLTLATDTKKNTKALSSDSENAKRGWFSTHAAFGMYKRFVVPFKLIWIIAILILSASESIA